VTLWSIVLRIPTGTHLDDVADAVLLRSLEIAQWNWIQTNGTAALIHGASADSLGMLAAQLRVSLSPDEHTKEF
jgi:hypothetical protein